MEVIKIVNTSRGEVAYLWNGKQVIKTWVKDFTQIDSDPALEFEEEIVEELEPIPMPSQPKRGRPPLKPRIEIPIGPDGLPDLPRGETPKKSVIPPGMRSMFVEGGMPGEDVTKIRR